MQEYITVTGIVLKQTPVGEYDRHISLLTKERGKVSAFARGARKPGGRLAAATGPFCFGSFKLYQGRSAYTLAEAEIHVNPEKAAVSVQLPHSQILSHEIPEDSIEVLDETKNIFNPISIQDYTGFTKDQKNEIEVKILSDGFLEEADEKARTAVEAVLTVILEAEGYTLEVTTEK